MAQELIQMRGIVKRFYVGEPNELEILHGIDLDVYAGEFVSIVGASGSGKSTLMNLIGALDRPTLGSYLLDGRRIEEAEDSELSAIRNKKIGFVFQNFNLISRTNAKKNVELPMLYAGMPARQRSERAELLLDMVEMSDRMTHQPSELSGGQKQRVAIAGTIAMQPECIIFDEATAMLDPQGRRDVMDTIRMLHDQKHLTILHITHNMDEAVLADRVIVIDDGRILLDDTPGKVFSQVETLNKVGLDVPQPTDLLYDLNREGFSFPLDRLSPEDAADVILNYYNQKIL